MIRISVVKVLVASAFLVGCAAAPTVKTHDAGVTEPPAPEAPAVPSGIADAAPETPEPPPTVPEAKPVDRAQAIMDMKWGMFICWSFSTFSGREWTPTLDKGPDYFKATGCDTDQWARTAKEARMGYILFLTKHHDGFCLWDTDTTAKKVTNSPLGVDVLAKLRKSCDKYGIKLALYFSEGDWNWPGAIDGKGGRGGTNPEAKKAQLKELCTRYGPIEFFWMDHAIRDGGLGHEETVEWIHKFQPDCFVGFNHGTPAGRLCIRERGRPGSIGDANATKYNKDAEKSHKGYEVAEFTYPILPKHKGGAQWFYSLPKHDGLCHPATKLYSDYAGAMKHGNIFSIDAGPNYEGRLRDIDVRTLREVGEMIANPPPPPPPPPRSLSVGKTATASSTWSAEHDAAKAFDDDDATRWGAAQGSRSGWLQVDIGRETLIGRAVVMEIGFPRTREFALEYRSGDEWRELASGTTLGARREIVFAPVRARHVRLNIIKATDVPTIEEFRLYPPKGLKP